MTTIAIKDGILAVDTRVVGPSIGKVKKWWVNNNLNCVMATSGSLDYMSGLEYWTRTFESWDDFVVRYEARPRMEEDRGYTLVIIDGDCVVREFTSHARAAYVVDNNHGYAIGGGGDYALGAMSMGASAEEAVKVAMLHDPYTGGDVAVVDVRSVLSSGEGVERVPLPANMLVVTLEELPYREYFRIPDIRYRLWRKGNKDGRSFYLCESIGPPEYSPCLIDGATMVERVPFKEVNQGTTIEHGYLPARRRGLEA